MRAKTLVVTLGLLTACGGSSTKLISTWADPTASPIRFSHVLAICACKDASLRRNVEDRLAQDIPGAQPAYRVLSDSQLDDSAAVRAAVTANNVDGVVVMRLVSVDRTSTYVPGDPYIIPVGYRRMWGWGYRTLPYGALYDPGYVRQDQLVNYDTNVYSVSQQRLVWASRSQTTNPTSVPKLVDEVVNATAKEMRRQNLIP